MNKICNLGAIALLASSTIVMAQTKSFEGASLGIFGGGLGVSAEGNSTTTANPGGSTTSGSGNVGTVSGIGGLDLAYGFGIGKDTVISIGATYVPFKADITTGSSNDSTAGGAVTAEMKDHYTIYIQPTFVINKDSAAFLKVSYAHADLSVSGQTARLTTGDIEGYGVGAGLKTFLTPNLFMQVEASYTDYDTIRGTKTNSNSGRVTTVSADPKLVSGLITLGYKF